MLGANLEPYGKDGLLFGHDGGTAGRSQERGSLPGATAQSRHGALVVIGTPCRDFREPYLYAYVIYVYIYITILVESLVLRKDSQGE